ncbi:hypothetical protein SAMN03080602_03246 [Arenibacter troitsensis]|uniref:Uncharacterized protein n=1 Tax=Arenibacter troitsensis TaxID=188872 RepID=A0A1X7KS78_9FLAO|nr:hypothetical protein SAMN03080602_03246 [Arenibacter troitsensis]
MLVLSSVCVQNIDAGDIYFEGFFVLNCLDLWGMSILLLVSVR